MSNTVIAESHPPSEATTTRADPVRPAVAALALSVLLSSLGTSIANVALPTLSGVFSAPLQSVQWIVLAYLLAITTLIVGVGRLGDIIGRRRLLLTGIGVFTVASAACGAAPALWMLVAARAGQGAGAAVMIALSMALLGETVSKARTGRVMGLLGTMSAIGTALGPTLGGVLIATSGWRAVFLVTVPLGLLTLLLAGRYLPSERREAGADSGGFDPVGMLLLALALAAYALATTLGRGRFGLLNLALLVAALSGVVLFVVMQARTASPVIHPALLRDTALSTGLATSAMVSTVIMATLVVGPFHLAQALGLGPAQVGLSMSVGPAIAALTAAPAGRMVDRLGTDRLTVVGLFVMATGCMILSIFPTRFGAAGYIAAVSIITAGYALFQTANNTGVLTNAAPSHRGVVSGMLNLSRNLGLITGASMMGAVFGMAAGVHDITAAHPGAVATGTQITFAVSAILIAFALALVVARRALTTSATSTIEVRAGL